MRRPLLLMALGVALLMGAAQASVFREQLGTTFRQGASLLRDLLQVLFGSPAGGVTTVSTDPCATVSAAVGGLIGADAFCLGPDGGSSGTQVDGGPLLAFAAYPTDGGGPVTGSASRCPNGPNCDAVTFRFRDGGSGIEERSGTTASPAGNISCVLGIRVHTTATSYVLAKRNAVPTFHIYTQTGTLGVSVNKAGGNGTAVTSASTAIQTYAWHTVGFSYTFVADGTSLLSAYVDGASVGSPSTSAVGPLAASTEAFEIGGRALGTQSPMWGDVAFAACSEDAWTTPEHLAIATAMRAVWTEQVTGSAITHTRASTSYCDPLDGGYGTWLGNNEPCIVGGAYLSEPAATPKALYTDDLDTTSARWTQTLVSTSANDAAAPDGTMTADTMVASDETDAPHCIQQSITTTAAAWTASAYVKAGTDGFAYLSPNNGTSNAWFNLTTCATATITGFTAGARIEGGGFCRIWASKTMTAAANVLSVCVSASDNSKVPSASGSIVVWIPNEELGAVATTPVNSEGTALTRAATVATVPNPLNGLNPESWCMGGKVKPLGSAWVSAEGVMALGASAPNYARLYNTSATNGKFVFEVYDSNSALREFGITALVSAAEHTIFGCTNNGTLSIWVDGASVAGTQSGAGTGIVATQPATAYLAARGTAGVFTGYGSAWRAFTGGYR